MVKKPKVIIKTRSGKDAPKMVAKTQASAMTAKKFLKLAETLEIDVFGNKLSAPARVYDSGNKGWYVGGKVEIPLGKQTLWAQMSCNVTIVGSKSWDDE